MIVNRDAESFFCIILPYYIFIKCLFEFCRLWKIIIIIFMNCFFFIIVVRFKSINIKFRYAVFAYTDARRHFVKLRNLTACPAANRASRFLTGSVIVFCQFLSPCTIYYKQLIILIISSKGALSKMLPLN